MTLTIAPGRRHFLLDGEPFFYLADTVWAAFSNASMDEWRLYVRRRREQGFTAVQLSLMPIVHDRSESPAEVMPFERRNGRFDFDRPEEGYLRRAAEMVEVVWREGLVPALVLLWCNYVPGTWAATRTGQSMTLDQVDAYLRRALPMLGLPAPILLVSGDTDWAGEAVRYYGHTLRLAGALLPDALTTLHTNPDSADIPAALAEMPQLDFYMYQSGHQRERQDRAPELARLLAAKSPRRPVVNGEPCYEGHGHFRSRGRFSAAEVRWATWQSLLSGAGAGITYGAHGLWSWHRPGDRFTSTESSGEPLPWSSALELTGAWDVAFARAVFELYGLHGAVPSDDLVVDAPEDVAAAAAPDGSTAAVYQPVPSAVRIGRDLRGRRNAWLDLSLRRWLVPEVSVADHYSAVAMPDTASDLLLLTTA